MNNGLLATARDLVGISAYGVNEPLTQEVKLHREMQRQQTYCNLQSQKQFHTAQQTPREYSGRPSTVPYNNNKVEKQATGVSTPRN